MRGAEWWGEERWGDGWMDGGRAGEEMAYWG